MGYFGESSQRIKDFREELLSTPAYICAERGELYTQAHKQHKAEPIILQRANCVANVLEHMSIFIEKETLSQVKQIKALKKTLPGNRLREIDRKWVFELY